MNVYLHSLGCRLNQSEAESVARRFAAAGHIVVDDPTGADVCLVNTCTVTRAEGDLHNRLPPCGCQWLKTATWSAR